MERLRVAVVALLFLASITACNRKESAKTLRLAQTENLYSLDPDRAADAQSRAILSNIYEALVEFDSELKIHPALATSWSAPDELTWIFELRKGVKFHDGHLLTAVDVKASFERVGGLGIRDAVLGISGVDAIDDSHVRLRLKHPSPLLLNRLTQILIVPASQARGQIDHPIGTGPYRFVQRTKNELYLEFFNQYWRRITPYVKQVIFLAVPAKDSFDRFEHGNLDLYRLLPASIAKQMPRDVAVIGRSGLAMMYLWFNCSPQSENQKNPFSDVRVRQAVSLVVDRNRIVQRLGGSDMPSDQLIPEGVFGFIPSWKKLPHNPEDAKRLMEEAGYPHGFQTSLIHPPGESYTQLAAAIAEMLAPIGIRVQNKELPFVDFLEARRNQQLPFFALTWTFDDGDAWTFLMASLHSKAGPQDYRSTNPGYSNPQIDRLIEESQQVTEVSDISTRYENILKIAISEMPLIPLYRRYDLYGVSHRVRFTPRLDGKLLAVEMQLVD